MWQILDINGKVIKTFDDEKEAEQYAYCCVQEECFIIYKED